MSADELDGYTYVRCGNRRAAVCPSCSREYKGDAWHVIMCGLAGGKGENAMRDGLVIRNVAKLVKVMTPTYEIGRGLTVDQARTLLRLSGRDRFHAAYVLAVYLGLRRAEVLGLRWKDTDLDAGWLQVAQTLQRVDGELRFLPPKTRHSRRTVPLPRPCLKTLRRLSRAARP